MAADLGGSGRGKAFLISAAVMLEAIAAACSSPQTTELNAEARSETLMKWVSIGLGLGVVLVVIGAAVDDDNNAGPILAGGLITGGAMWVLYSHARRAGLAGAGPPTESY